MGEEYTKGYPFQASYMGSFSYDALFTALWAFHGADSFASVVERCVNLLGDADSTGAIAGMLGGAFFGFQNSFNSASTGIPKFLTKLDNSDNDGEIALRTLLLHAQSLKFSGETKITPK